MQMVNLQLTALTMGKEDNTMLDILEQTELILVGKCSVCETPWSLVVSSRSTHSAQRQACSGQDAHADICLLLWTDRGVCGNLCISVAWMHHNALDIQY
jgi:hypothetical protein